MRTKQRTATVTKTKETPKPGGRGRVATWKAKKRASRIVNAT